MSTFAQPLVQNTLPPPVVRVIRQFESDQVIFSHYANQRPRDISAWRVRVVEIERKLCAYNDAGGSVAGPYAAFAAPAAPPGAAAADFAVTQPDAVTAGGVANSYAIRYPADAWPWHIAAAGGRLPTTPLVIVRVEIALPGGIVHRRPFGLAIISSDTSR